MNASEAAEVIRYDPVTGQLFWTVTRNHHAVSGKRVTSKAQGYIAVRVFGKSYLGHRLAWLLTYGEWPSLDIDHKNGIKDDNRLMNLRLANHTQQNANKIGYSKRGLPKGVVTSKRKFQAHIYVSGRRFNLGSFRTPEEAHTAYCQAAKTHFGDYFHDGSRRTA